MCASAIPSRDSPWEDEHVWTATTAATGFKRSRAVSQHYFPPFPFGFCRKRLMSHQTFLPPHSQATSTLTIRLHPSCAPQTFALPSAVYNYLHEFTECTAHTGVGPYDGDCLW